jgi:hypothetical protein
MKPEKAALLLFFPDQALIDLHLVTLAQGGEAGVDLVLRGTNRFTVYISGFAPLGSYKTHNGKAKKQADA